MVAMNFFYLSLAILAQFSTVISTSIFESNKLLGFNKTSAHSSPDLVKCTVSPTSSFGSGFFTIEYICQTYNGIIYPIEGGIVSLTGLPFVDKSSKTIFTFPRSIINQSNVLDLHNNTIRSSISFSSTPFDVNLGFGTHKGLIIRVMDNTGDEPDESANELYGAFYDDNINFGVSVKSVYLGCSNGQFELIPATGNKVTDGVIEITLDYNVADVEWKTVSSDVMSQISNLDSSAVDDYTFDFIVFPSSVNFKPWGKAAFGTGRSWYRSGRMQKVVLPVHEIGHNLYQDHSGVPLNDNPFIDDTEETADASCTMGGEWGTKSDGQKCFNAAKTYYMGWFSDYSEDLFPSKRALGATLVGVNDAVNDEISLGEFVTIKVSDDGATNLYLMYNRVEGVHKFLEDSYYRDKVVVVEQDGSRTSDDYWAGVSMVKAVLDQGDTYTQYNWAGTDNSLKIKVCSIVFGTPDSATVGIWLKGVNSINAACKASPTVSPAPTPMYKEITYFSDPCIASFPNNGFLCEECTGHCINDSDCAGDLICSQRDGGEDVPGCTWGASSESLKNGDNDFCYDPSNSNQPSTSNSPSISPNSSNQPSNMPSVRTCNKNKGESKVELRILPDVSYETVWVLKNLCTGQNLAEGTYEGTTLCVSDDERFAFTIYDSYGDGICCDYGDGMYSVYFDGKLIYEGGGPDNDFLKEETTKFGAKKCPSDSCEDPKFTFKMQKNSSSKKKKKTCNKISENWCNNKDVSNTCPDACKSCDTYKDSPYKFKVKKKQRDCRWVQRSRTKQRCQSNGVKKACRKTCKKYL